MKVNSRKNVRLSQNVLPSKYKITIKPDFSTFTFSGEEAIILNFKESSKEITLHAKELEIDKAIFIQKDREQEAAIFFDDAKETVSFIFSEEIKKGEGKLSISFRGVLNDKMRGFYRSKYTVAGKERYLATTQFEAVDARKAFPCFDEPAFKAVFEVALIVPERMVAISNTLPAVVTKDTTGLKTVEFSPTPPMSTYLLAFIVGHFESIETRTEEGVLVRVFVTPGKKKQARFALDVAAKALSFYSDYFGISYPLPVMDLIAIPDFAAGAMENWGAVTYRESALLIDENLSSLANKQWVALVIAHELAHQWFGNLVTMEWWTHLWLNEGFASFMEYVAVDSIFPDWDVWTQFTALEKGTALRLDGLKNTHPIEIEVNDPAEINEIFDAVSYSKGASIIRMLSQYLGREVFRSGLKYYLSKYKYSNATTQDLWIALEKVSKKPVRKIIANWTAKPGYPVLSIKDKGEKLEISQKRFFSSRVVAQEEKDKTLWSIPFSIVSSDLRPVYYLLSQRSILIPKPHNSWAKINSGESSFARVNYPSNFLLDLKGPIEEKLLPSVDRLGVIRDAFALSEAGYMRTADVLKISESYKEEDDYAAWIEIASYLRQIANLIHFEKYYSNYEIYCQSIFSSIAARVGWEEKPSEKHTDKLLRSLALFAFGSYGDKNTIENAQKLFRKIEKGEKIDPELRSVVFNLIVQNGNEKIFKKLINLYKTEELQQEKDRIGRALGAFQDQAILEKTLKFSLSKYVRGQSVIPIISSVWGNPVGRKVAWKFVKENWDELKKRFEGGHLLSRLLQSAEEFISEKEAADFEKFFKKNPVPEASRTIAQALEQIRSNQMWLKEEKKSLEKLLSKV